MMKFFRKHTKHLLAFFMALLLVVWLLDPTIRRMAGGGGRPEVEWGEVYGKTIPVSDVMAVQHETEMLAALRLDWSRFWMMVIPVRREPLQPREWYMLEAEARKRGIYVPQGDVQALRKELPPEAIQAVREKYQASIEDIDQAIQSFLRVERMFLTDLEGPKLSEADIDNYIRNTQEKAKVKMAILEAKAFEDPAYKPTDEELKAQFEKHKDQDPNPRDGGFGYRLPAEVQIQYIEVRADALAKRQEVSDDEANTYWKNHKTKFTKPRTTTQPTTAPAQPYEFYSEAREAVFKELRTEKAKQEALRLGTELAKSLNEAWLNAPTTQPGNFKEPPAEALDPERYQKAVAAFSQKAGGALTYKSSPMLSRQAMFTLGPATRAQALPGTRDAATLGDVAFLVQGLEASPQERATKARWFHNLYETVAEPFVDSATGDVYVFRTVAVNPKHAPVDWTAVRDRLTSDLELLHGAQLAEQRANQLAERARQVGLEAAVNDDPALVAKLSPPPASRPGQPTPPSPPAVKTPGPFAREEPSPMGGGMSAPWIRELGFGPQDDFVKLVFSLAGKTTTQPARVAVFAPEKQRRWIVVQLMEVQPVTQKEAEQERDMAKSMLMRDAIMTLASSWLEPQTIRARVDYQPKYPEEDKQPQPQNADMPGPFGSQF